MFICSEKAPTQFLFTIRLICVCITGQILVYAKSEG